MAEPHPGRARQAFREACRFYELIEAYFPNLPKIELFARGKARPGWAVWGNETDDAA